MTTRSVSSAAVTLASAAPPPVVVMAAAATTTTAAPVAPVGGDRRSTRSSAGPPKRRRSDRKDVKEEDREEDHVSHNDMETKNRRSKVFEEEDAIATITAAATTIGPSELLSTSTNGLGGPQGRGRSNKWDLTPVSLLLRTLGYMDNDTLMIMCLVCQQIRDLIWSGQGLEKKLIRIFKLSASKNNNDYGPQRVRRFVSNMNQYFQNATKTRILQGFQHWKVQDYEVFNEFYTGSFIRDDELERLVTQNIRMPGIVALDMSSPLSTSHSFGTLQRAIAFMVPNLQQLDLSRTGLESFILRNFAVRCPRLEIIRWNYRREIYGSAAGDELQTMNNLKEVYFDNSYFCFNRSRIIDEDGNYAVDDDDNNDNDDNRVTEFEAMLDNNNYPNIFFFHKFSNKPLERLSIRNAEYADPQWVNKILPQQILMKFVRKAPSTLVWFRSDLSAENIRILQSERPGIEFLN